jgi:hypothetical protein
MRKLLFFPTVLLLVMTGNSWSEVSKDTQEPQEKPKFRLVEAEHSELTISGFVKGKQLESWCVHARDNERIPASTYCLAYLYGIADAMSFYSSLETSMGKQGLERLVKVCFPKNVSGDHLIKTFLDHEQEDPSWPGRLAIFPISDSFQTAWPCK